MFVCHPWLAGPRGGCVGSAASRVGPPSLRTSFQTIYISDARPVGESSTYTLYIELILIVSCPRLLRIHQLIVQRVLGEQQQGLGRGCGGSGDGGPFNSPTIDSYGVALPRDTFQYGALEKFAESAAVFQSAATIIYT